MSQFPQEGRVWGAAGRQVFSPGGRSLVPQGQGGAWALSAGPGAGAFCDPTWTPGFLTPTFQSLLHPQGPVILPLWTLFNVSFHCMKTTLFLHFYFYIYLTAKQVMQLGYKWNCRKRCGTKLNGSRFIYSRSIIEVPGKEERLEGA